MYIHVMWRIHTMEALAPATPWKVWQVLVAVTNSQFVEVLHVIHSSVSAALGINTAPGLCEASPT